MNIKDFKKQDLKLIKNDFLKTIFHEQRELMKKYAQIEHKKGIYVPEKIPVDLNNCLDQQRIKDMAFRCITELIEATECLKNKPWKQTEVLTDVDHLYEEIADVMHFFVELCILVGITPFMLCVLYHKKLGVNRFRQQSHY